MKTEKDRIKISDLKVGERFVNWRLGWDTRNNDFLPEHIRDFYDGFTIEKVNSKSFYANGEKFTEVPLNWMKYESDNYLERYICSVCVARHFEFDACNTIFSRNHSKIRYMRAISKMSDEIKEEFKNKLLKKTEKHFEELKTHKLRELFEIADEYIRGRKLK